MKYVCIDNTELCQSHSVRKYYQYEALKLSDNITSNILKKGMNTSITNSSSTGTTAINISTSILPVKVVNLKRENFIPIKLFNERPNVTQDYPMKKTKRRTSGHRNPPKTGVTQRISQLPEWNV